MTVKELLKILADVEQDMEVVLIIEDHLKPGMFAFAPACTCESGVIELGPNENGEGGGESVFLVAPHGAGLSEPDTIEGDETIPELN